jgi:hemolysin activation/secretion protein
MLLRSIFPAMRFEFQQPFIPRRRATPAGWLFLALAWPCADLAAQGLVQPEEPPALPYPAVEPGTAAAMPEREVTFPVRQIRVRGVKTLTADEIASAIYPYLGMGRTLDDLEQARAALEKAYRDKGYQTVGVELPVQNGTRGIIYMLAVENSVGRLRVRGAEYHLPSKIKENAPSLKEGTVPKFNEVQKDIVALNAWPDRRVTPSLVPGVLPGTVDVDLTVEDSLPIHGSIELNNRYNAGTTPLRLNGSVNYDNLWQLGHSLGLSTQLAPERIADAEIYSAYYIARFAQAPNFSLMLSGTKQNSDISTLGGAAVAGRGEIVGIRGMFNLPGRQLKEGESYFHSFSTGFDYKKFNQDVELAGEVFSAPIDYLPFTVAYGGGWVRDKSFTEINASLNMHFRGVGSEPREFDVVRFDSDGSYFYFRGDTSHTQDLPWGFEAFGKIQGQATRNPLINNEQYAGGGASTVRGYLEVDAIADSGWFLTGEIRTPSLLPSATRQAKGVEEEKTGNEWRFHAFYDGGQLYLNNPLPDQIDLFRLASWGLGTRFTVREEIEGSLEVAWPLEDQGATLANDPFLLFQMKAGF